jgi:hypothetical protein
MATTGIYLVRGVLLVAHHRGVWGLGVLLVSGSAMTLTASLVLLPTLARLGERRAPAISATGERALNPHSMNLPQRLAVGDSMTQSPTLEAPATPGD